jgi:hypothetical protein
MPSKTAKHPKALDYSVRALFITLILQERLQGYDANRLQKKNTV